MAEMPYDEKWDKPTPAQLEAAKPYRIRHYAAIWIHYMKRSTPTCRRMTSRRPRHGLRTAIR